MVNENQSDWVRFQDQGTDDASVNIKCDVSHQVRESRTKQPSADLLSTSSPVQSHIGIKILAENQFLGLSQHFLQSDYYIRVADILGLDIT